MTNTYGIAITCVASDRLSVDEKGEEFFECMSEEELEQIQKEKDKESLKTHLLNTLSMMDSTLSNIITSIEKGTPTYIKIIFMAKDAIKGSALNISNKELSATEIVILGGVTIGIGIFTALALPEGIIGIIIS